MSGNTSEKTDDELQGKNISLNENKNASSSQFIVILN
jgi:hypothetical protein